MTDEELKKLIASLAEEHRKTESALTRLAKEHRKTEIAQQKTEASLRELKRQMGGLGNIQGEIAEALFHRNLKSLMKQRGIILERVDNRIKGPNSDYEYDLIGFNGQVLVLVEIKNKLAQKDIEEFIEQKIVRFRIDWPDYAKHKLIGGIGSLVIKKEVEQRAEALGLYVLTQKGEEGATIVNKRDFKAKLF